MEIIVASFMQKMKIILLECIYNEMSTSSSEHKTNIITFSSINLIMPLLLCHSDYKHSEEHKMSE